MKKKQLLHIFGEVLFDHFPDASRVIGGAPFNVAWHLQALGQTPRFISRIGDDLSGREALALAEAWGMSAEALQIDQQHPTGSVTITFEQNEPQYEIVEHCAYDFIDAKAIKNTTTQGILYHGSLALRNNVSLTALQSLKKKHHGKIFMDVNLRSPWWQAEQLLPLFKDATWVKMNIQELCLLMPEHKKDIKKTIQAFRAQYNLELLIITLGAKGALVCDQQQRFFATQPTEDTKVIDTVGAGDAFSAIMLLGLSQQWPLQEALDRAQAFASAIVGRRGATVADTRFYRTFCKQWNLLSGH